MPTRNEVLMRSTNLLNDLYICEDIDVMETDEDIDKLGMIILFDDKSLEKKPVFLNLIGKASEGNP